MIESDQFFFVFHGNHTQGSKGKESDDWDELKRKWDSEQPKKLFTRSHRTRNVKDKFLTKIYIDLPHVLTEAHTKPPLFHAENKMKFSIKWSIWWWLVHYYLIQYICCSPLSLSLSPISRATQNLLPIFLFRVTQQGEIYLRFNQQHLTQSFC